MIDTPEIAHSPEQQVALIHLTVPRSQIQTVMGPAFQELGKVLKEQGIAPTGPWFAHHLHRPTDVFDFEICSPVPREVQPSGRVTNGKIRATKVARTTSHGPYDHLPASWGEFVAWIEANGHRTSTDLWEVYLVGPNDTPNSADWRTQLNAPLTEN